MASISSIGKHSIAITRDSLKNCTLACKTRNKIHNNFEKRKVPKLFSGILVKNGCSACSVQCMYLWPKFLKNKFEVVYTLG